MPYPQITIDLETTHETAATGVVLEFGVLASDREFHAIDAGTSGVIGHDLERINPLMPPDVRKMHNNSGLLKEVAASDLTLNAAEDQILDYLDQHDPGKFAAVNTKPEFDRRWVWVHMPRVAERLSHVEIDVLSVRRWLRQRHPEVVESAPKDIKRHRVMHDIHDALRELRHYGSALRPWQLYTPEELPEFFNAQSAQNPHEITQWDTHPVTGDELPVAVYSTPEEAEAAADRLKSAAYWHRRYVSGERYRAGVVI